MAGKLVFPFNSVNEKCTVSAGGFKASGSNTVTAFSGTTTCSTYLNTFNSGATVSAGPSNSSGTCGVTLNTACSNINLTNIANITNATGAVLNSPTKVSVSAIPITVPALDSHGVYNISGMLSGSGVPSNISVGGLCKISSTTYLSGTTAFNFSTDTATQAVCTDSTTGNFGGTMVDNACVVIDSTACGTGAFNAITSTTVNMPSPIRTAVPKVNVTCGTGNNVHVLPYDFGTPVPSLVSTNSGNPVYLTVTPAQSSNCNDVVDHYMHLSCSADNLSVSAWNNTACSI